MNVNFGLFPPLHAPTLDANGNAIKGRERGAAKKRALTARALADLDRWLRLARPRRGGVASRHARCRCAATPSPRASCDSGVCEAKRRDMA